MNSSPITFAQSKIVNAVDIESIARLLANSDVFDADFYSQYYIGHSVNPIYAAAHYLFYGHYDLRNPSAKFSTAGYLNKHSDVKALNRLAGLHYLQTREKESRAIFPAPQINSDAILINTSDVTDIVKPDKIAIVIHVFYDDYNTIFAHLLSAYTFQFDLFITSSQQSVLDDFIAQLQHHKVNCAVKTALCPNRGRNFAPFLVEFGSQLRDYDLIGHVHSKKSLHHGVARRDWGLACATGVLGSPEYVAFVMNELLVKQEYGIVCAEKYASAVAYFGYHWLKNFEIADLLAQELGLSIENGFVNYPIGGMFWARKDAIAKILAKDWSYDDFPDEEGQLDGTAQHALERLIGSNCEQVGLKMLKWDAESGAFNNHPAPGVRDFRQISKQTVQNKIQAATVISFNIFDTLLYRDVFSSNKVLESLEAKYPDYSSLRAAAEIAAKNSLSANSSLCTTDIAIELAKRLNISWADAIALLNLEFEKNLLALRPRYPMIELVSHAKTSGKRVIYVCDSHYGEAQIISILEHFAIPVPDKLYLSSMIGLRKDQGTLWKQIRQQEAGHIFHLGSNMVADVQFPGDSGVEAMFVPSVQEKTKMLNIFCRKPEAKESDILFPLVEHFGVEPFFC